MGELEVPWERLVVGDFEAPYVAIHKEPVDRDLVFTVSIRVQGPYEPEDILALVRREVTDCFDERGWIKMDVQGVIKVEPTPKKEV